MKNIITVLASNGNKLSFSKNDILFVLQYDTTHSVIRLKNCSEDLYIQPSHEEMLNLLQSKNK